MGGAWSVDFIVSFWRERMLHTLIVAIFLSGASHPVQTYRMTYPTQYTCDQESALLRGDEIAQWYQATHKHIGHKPRQVSRVVVRCEKQKVPDDRECGRDWYARCNDSLFVS
jgi:hypothetical protein